MKSHMKYGAVAFLLALTMAASFFALFTREQVTTQSQMSTEAVRRESRQLKITFEEFTERITLEFIQGLQAALAQPGKTDALTGSDFLAFGLLSTNGSELAHVEWFKAKENQFDKSFFESVLASVSGENLSSEKVRWARFKGLSDKEYIILSTQLRLKTQTADKERLAVAVLPENYLVAFLSEANVQAFDASAEIFLLSEEGKFLASSQTVTAVDYLETHPAIIAFKERVSSASTLDLETIKIGADDYILSTQPIKNSNVQLMLSRKLSSSTFFSASTILMTLFICAIFSILVVLSVYLKWPQKYLFAANTELNREGQDFTELSKSTYVMAKYESLRAEYDASIRVARAILSAIRPNAYAAVGRLQILTERLKGEDRKDVGFILEQCSQIQNVINEFDTASDVHLPNSEAIDLAEAGRQVLASFSQSMTQASIQFEEHLIPGLYVRAARRDLEFILSLPFLHALQIATSQRLFCSIKTVYLPGWSRFEFSIKTPQVSGAELKSDSFLIALQDLRRKIAKSLLANIGGDYSVSVASDMTVIKIDFPRALESTSNLLDFEIATPDADLAAAKNLMEVAVDMAAPIHKIDFVDTKPLNDKVPTEVTIRAPKVRAEL